MNDINKKIILAGGSGFLGQSLARHFAARGCEVVVLSRRPAPDQSRIRGVQWDAKGLGDWARELDGAHALINLTGRSVDCRYSAANRKEILGSRLDATRVLGEAIRGCAKQPGVWLNAASATIYADTRGDTPANDEEQGVIGEGFSVDVCRAWEKTFWDAEVPGLRKVLMRIAIVLGEAGAMGPMKRMARLGLGGKMGSGEQFMSWLHVEDFVRMVDFLIENQDARGTYNLASPFPVPNREFMCSLRAALGRSLGLPSPRWLLELGARFIRTETELILKSRKVVPRRLEDAGFSWTYPRVKQALDSLV
jgi:uncharacterized protein (TIGR01777 family)